MKKNRVIVKGRMAFAHLNNPSNVDKKYGMTLIISKDDDQSVGRIKEAIECVKESSKEKWGGYVPNNLKIPLHDGDIEKPEKAQFRNSFYLNAKCSDPPQIVDRNVEPIENRAEVYSGCFINVSLVFYGYNMSGNRGIGVWLGNIQKIKDGPRMAKNHIDARDEFEVIM